MQYYVIIYNWLNDKIQQFGLHLVQHMMAWAAGIALVLVTLWIMIQGYRVLTGQMREPLMSLVANMARIAFIVTVATTMSMLGSNLMQLLGTQLPTEINQLVSGSSSSPQAQIDKNLAQMQIVLSVIDDVKVPSGDAEDVAAKTHAELIAGLGAAGPAMTAGAMLLLYQIAMALFIGLGPLFILCLIFDQTKQLFHRWLLYGLGTMFSLAMLAFVSALALDITLRVAAALFASDLISQWTGITATGMTSQALQQGGLGLLMTVLIITTPPMAAMFFQGTLGNFLFQSAFGPGGATAAAMQNGLPPNAYGGYLQAPAPAASRSPSTGHQSGYIDPNLGARGAFVAATASADSIKPHNPTTAT